MSVRSYLGRGLTLLVIVASTCSLVSAEDVEKKFRLGLAVGGYNNTDEISSDSANRLTLVDEDQLFQSVFVDPRDDSAVFGTLDINSGPIATLSAQYAVTQVFVIEASVGYNKTDVGKVDVQAQFRGADIPDLERFNFSTFRVSVGEMTRIPVQFTALARFRPRASFNPYLGAGIGYSFIGVEPSDEFNALSVNMDASLGGQARLTEATYGAQELRSPNSSEIGDMQGATITADDSFEWHLVGGAELTFKRKWVAFMDLRWIHGSQSLTVGFNGGNYLGVAVPQLTDYVDSEAASRTYGAYFVDQGGLLDGGSLQLRPAQGQPPDLDCETQPTRCETYFDTTAPDGEVDTGFYYAQGGTVDYGGLALQIGVRFTF